jgi:hypothetical protein
LEELGSGAEGAAMTIDCEYEAYVMLVKCGALFGERETKIAERILRSVAKRAQNEALEEAAVVCEKWQGDLGIEHAELCDCITVVCDECSCHLSEPQRLIRALKEASDG